jgi:hypothetical protein
MEAHVVFESSRSLSAVQISIVSCLQLILSSFTTTLRLILSKSMNCTAHKSDLMLRRTGTGVAVSNSERFQKIVLSALLTHM